MKKIHTIEALCSEVKKSVVINDVFPSTFPANAEHTCAVVSFIGGTPTRDTVKYSTMQIVTRAERPSDSYALSIDVQEYFTSMRGVELLSGEIVVMCTAQSPYPFYLGEDENRRHMYSTNYSLILSTE